MTQDRKIKLGFILHGVGRTWNDWRHPDRDTSASTSFPYYKRQAQLAEKGKFDFLFVADSLSITEKSHPLLSNRVGADHHPLRAGGGDQSYRPRRYIDCFLFGAVQRRPPVRLAGSYQRRGRRGGRRHLLAGRYRRQLLEDRASRA